jgi:polysaccharide export outer membrane protein
VVSVVEQRTSLITVLLDGTARRIPASAAPERVLDVIARAGGTGGPGADMWVVLERNRRRAVAPFAALFRYGPATSLCTPTTPSTSIASPRFLASGALGSSNKFHLAPGTFRFCRRAKLAGSWTARPIPPAVLVSQETRRAALELGIDCTTRRFGPGHLQHQFPRPAGYFLATNLEMRNKMRSAFQLHIGRNHQGHGLPPPPPPPHPGSHQHRNPGSLIEATAHRCEFCFHCDHHRYALTPQWQVHLRAIL